jgi:hypothetical protein
MRKCVKLVASALAAIAVVGGSSTAASADSKPIENKPVKTNPVKAQHAEDLPGKAKPAKDQHGKAKPGKDGPSGAQNFCGNDSSSVVSAKDNGHNEIGDIFQGEQSNQVICQIGENNYAITYKEGDLIGADTVYALGAVIGNLAPSVGVNSRN